MSLSGKRQKNQLAKLRSNTFEGGDPEKQDHQELPEDEEDQEQQDQYAEAQERQEPVDSLRQDNQQQIEMVKTARQHEEHVEFPIKSSSQDQQKDHEMRDMVESNLDKSVT